MSEKIENNELEKQASDSLLMRAITSWQRMDRGSFEEFVVPADINFQEELIGSRARTFNTEINGKDVGVALIFWSEGGKPEKYNSSSYQYEDDNEASPGRTQLFSVIVEEPWDSKDSKLTDSGKKQVVATTVNMTNQGLTVDEETKDYPAKYPDFYRNPRDVNPGDIQLVSRVLDNVENGEIHSTTDSYILHSWGHTQSIWESLTPEPAK